jgi:hypothetical protein
MKNAQPIISFTFDDFPRSALQNGGAILRSFGFQGTFFASFGLMGGTGPTGKIFIPEDLSVFGEGQHEIGCHTFDHYHSWKAKARDFHASIRHNREVAAEYVPNTKWESFSYPLSFPSPQVKRAAGNDFVCCRGGGQSFNRDVADLNCLKGYFLEQSGNDLGTIERLIEGSARRLGWLIFATHDVDRLPTRFGCTPAFFEQVVQLAARSGALILSTSRAAKIVERGMSNGGSQCAEKEDK